MARDSIGNLAVSVSVASEADVLSDWIVAADAVESTEGRFVAGSTSAGLALIRDEADPMLNGGKYKVVKCVSNMGELL
jgi:hypothetical protein